MSEESYIDEFAVQLVTVLESISPNVRHFKTGSSKRKSIGVSQENNDRVAEDVEAFSSYS